MKKLFEFTPKIFLVITFLFAVFLSFFQLNPVIDTGRELYIPLRMLNGELLYKDIVNIYGSLAYQINTLLYTIFGVGINSLRIFAVINSTLIIWLFMLICGEIFPIKNNSNHLTNKINWYGQNGLWQFALIPFIIGVCSLGTFNYTFPYSFSMTYGLTYFLASILFFMKFTKNNEPNFAYLACLFAGSAIACKYDFFLYSLFLFLYILINKKISTLNVLNSLICLLVIPFLSFGLLFLQGVDISDLQETFALVSAIGRTHSLRYLYSNFSGSSPSLAVLSVSFLKTIILALIAFLVSLSKKISKSDKILTALIYVFAFAGLFYVGLIGYSLLAIINALIFCIFIKKIVQNKPLYVFMCASILFSFKTFFFINLDVYGTYTLPLIILSIVAFLFNIDYTDKKEVKSAINSFASILLDGLLVLCILKSFLIFIPKTQGQILTSIDNDTNSVTRTTSSIFVYPQVAKTLNEAVIYIKQNTKPTDKVVVVPETMFLNFVTKRPADNIFDSLTPMYFETFGEEFVINHFKQTKPEYFVLNNRDTSDYGKRFICKDYGKQFCRFVEYNYNKTATFGEGKYVMQLYKRNDL